MNQNTNNNVRIITAEDRGAAMAIRPIPNSNEIRVIRQQVFDCSASQENIDSFVQSMIEASNSENHGAMLRLEADSGRIYTRRFEDLCALRIRLDSDEKFLGKKFVEVHFFGGGFLRLVVSEDQAKSFEMLVDSDPTIVDWTAGIYRVIIRADQISGYEIDEYTKKERTYHDDRYSDYDSGYNNGGNNGGNDYRPRQYNNRDRRYDRRPSPSRY